ncbi:hypothetical protein H1P_1910001 [Hyella patelloides LEGE 07179]|uniref:S-layer family protein n=1 Tax=Hyella patelloides LEGE 07179 TaxID=945734 RepID=A0A563VP82_9CYAN|nr:hypothetical protein H1P_1910001 [Hyella patelloides LEGE 07179]
MINADSLNLENGGIISSSAEGRGNAGSIRVEATENVNIEGFTIFDEDTTRTSTIETELESGAVGNAGNVEITANSLSLSDNGEISSSTSGQGNAGNVRLNIAGEANLTDGNIFSNVEREAKGDGGNITIEAGSLSLESGGQIQTLVRREDQEEGLAGGRGDGGSISIGVEEDLLLSGIDENGLPSGILSQSGTGTVGNAGNIVINADSLNLENGGIISSSAEGRGNAGSIRVEATENVNIEGFNIFDENTTRTSTIETELGSGAVGDAGGIEITTSNLTLTNGGTVNASTSGTGDAGLVTIDASQNISAAGENSQGNVSGIFSNVGGNAVGNAGGIEITTAQLSLTGGGEVVATTFGDGDAGDLTVTASEYIELVGSNGKVPSGLFANTIEGDGNGGDLTIATDKLIVRDEAVITVGNFQQVVGSREPLPPGTGAAGNLKINAGSVEVSNQGKITADNASGIGGELTLKADSLTLENQASVSASTTADRGQGGIITLDIDDTLIIRDRSLISARADSGANGGNINIDAEFIIAYPSRGNSNGNDIIASAEQGQGGNIEITAESLFGIEERRAIDNNGTNDMDASSGTEGLDGAVTIETPDNNPLRKTTELSDNVVSPELVTTSNVCSASDIEDVSSLAIQGKGGIASESTAPFTADALILDGELETSSLAPNNDNFVDSNHIPPHIQPVAYKNNGEPVYLARGVIKQEDGTVILTAYPVDKNTPRNLDNSFGCNQSTLNK